MACSVVYATASYVDSREDFAKCVDAYVKQDQSKAMDAIAKGLFT